MRWLLSLACLVSQWTSSAQAAPQIVATPNQSTGVYEVGATVEWTVAITDDAGPIDGTATYVVKQGGEVEVAHGMLDLNGPAKVSASRTTPGTLLLVVSYKPSGAGKETIGYGGAAFAPDKIERSTPMPDDFEAFWAAKIAELDAVPMNLTLEPVEIGNDKIEYFKVTLDNIRGTKIYGQLAKPKGGKNLPALLQVQWAGVYPLNKDWITGYAQGGWLAFNISAHNLPIDQPEKFYADQAAKELNDYAGQGNDDRETAYFLRMFLSCRRAVDMLTQHADWDHKTLVVHGGSQGGYQALVTGGIHPAVTAVAAVVPAGCDHTGKQAGRSPGWPNWASRTWQGKDEQKMLTASRYFDAMNFASKIKGPTLVGLGLIDTACPAEGVLATCNQIPGPKEIVIMPQADHGGDHTAYQKRFQKFLNSQRRQ